MNKRYIKSILALLIGFAPVTYATENNLPEQNAQVQTVETQGLSQTAVTPVVESVPVTMPVKKQAPILVPFDLELYTLHCGSKKFAYGWNAFTKIGSLALGTVSIAAVLGAFVNNPMSFAPITFKGISDWWSSPWYWMIPLAIYNPLHTASKAFAFGVLVYGTYASAATLESDASNFFMWESRKDLLDATNKLKAALEMEKIWHEEVYARLGRPAIIGDVPAIEKYKIKGIRNGVEMIFDPFNREHVKAILGYNPSESCWRFEKIEIIPV